jgi:ferredoxin-NADP reductase
MAAATQPSSWRRARIVDAVGETVSARSLVFDVPGWGGHRAGQHVDVRLTAEDGYQAARSYSLSSAPDEAPQITVERDPDGEVSPFLVDVAEVDDTFEVRGPLGGYFVWDPTDQPLLLIGGGSGIAPLRSMWRAGACNAPVTVLYSARTLDRVIYRDELAAHSDLTVIIHLTRDDVPGFASGRIDAAALEAVVGGGPRPAVYVCGPTAFVETVATTLVGLLGHDHPIHTERFG